MFHIYIYIYIYIVCGCCNNLLRTAVHTYQLCRAEPIEAELAIASDAALELVEILESASHITLSQCDSDSSSRMRKAFKRNSRWNLDQSN